MPGYSVQRLKKLIRMAEGHRDVNRSKYQDILELTAPHLNGFDDHFNEMGIHSIHEPINMYNSESIDAAQNFVRVMMRDFTPVHSRWAEFEPGPAFNRVPEQRKEVEKVLESVTEVTFSYLNASNFGRVAPQMFYNLGIGDACFDIWADNSGGKSPLKFINNPLHKYAILADSTGDVFFTVVTRPAQSSELPLLYRGKLKLSQEVKRIIKEDPENEIKLQEVIYFDRINFVWRFEVLICVDGNDEDSKALEEIYAESPRITPRWLAYPGFSRGVGPFMIALPDQRLLNKFTEHEIYSSAISTFGMYTVAGASAANINNWTLTPGMFLEVERNGGPEGPSIAPMPGAGNFQAQQYLMEQTAQRMRNILLDESLPEQKAQPVSAFEFAERIKEITKNKGASHTQIHSEFVLPFFRRVVDVLQEAGAYDDVRMESGAPLPPKFSRFFDNLFVRVNITSPIARAQSLKDVEALMQGYGVLQQIAGDLAPLAIQEKKLPAWIFDKVGAPSSLVKGEKEIQESLDRIQQQQQQQQQLLMQQQAAQQQ